MPAATIFDPIPTTVAPVVALISFGPWPALVIPGLLVVSALLARHVFRLRRKVRELTDRDPLTGVMLHDHNCGMKCYRREIFDEVRLYGELHRFIPVLAAARGFRALR